MPDPARPRVSNYVEPDETQMVVDESVVASQYIQFDELPEQSIVEYVVETPDIEQTFVTSEGQQVDNSYYMVQGGENATVFSPYLPTK